MLWRSVDQSGNTTEAAQHNAEAAGVADRVELHTGDMTTLPFTDGMFDVVVSSLAIHNIGTPDGRRRAVDEAMRVLGWRFWYGGPWMATNLVCATRPGSD